MTSSKLDGPVCIELVYATPERQELMALEVTRHSTVDEVIKASRLPEIFAGQNFDACEVGIWGKLVDRDQRVSDGDRVEIYRPLAIDPREARRRLAIEGRSMGQSRENG